MKITSIEIQKRNKNRVNLYVDDNFECGLSLETIVKNHLKVGQELSERELDYFKNSRDKEYDKNVVDYVAEKLKNYGFVDDKVFATNFVKAKTKNQGKRKIAIMLKQKGVSEEIVEDAIEEFSCDREQIIEVAKKYLKNKPLDIKTKQKAYRYLASRGYNGEDIMPCLNRLMKGEENESWD